LEVAPEVVGMFASDAEPQQSGRKVGLPATAADVLHPLDRHVLDHRSSDITFREPIR
jgi:hypothetical protein